MVLSSTHVFRLWSSRPHVVVLSSTRPHNSRSFQPADDLSRSPQQTPPPQSLMSSSPHDDVPGADDSCRSRSASQEQCLNRLLSTMEKLEQEGQHGFSSLSMVESTPHEEVDHEDEYDPTCPSTLFQGRTGGGTAWSGGGSSSGGGGYGGSSSGGGGYNLRFFFSEQSPQTVGSLAFLCIKIFVAIRHSVPCGG